MLRWISACLVAVVSCGRHTGGASGLEVQVEYVAQGTAGCVRLDIVPAVGAANHAEVSLAGRPDHGTVYFAIVRADGWSDDVQLEVSLRAAGCADPPLRVRSVGTHFPATGVDTIVITLLPDGGAGGGAGGGSGGAAGGATAGGAAAGGAAGGAAGAMGCTGAFRVVPAPMTGDMNDVAPLPGGRAWFGASSAPWVGFRDPVQNGGAVVGASACQHQVDALWSHPVSGAAYLAGSFDAVARLELINAASCPPYAVTGTDKQATDVIGFAVGATARLFVTHDNGLIIHADVTGAIADSQTVADHIAAIDGPGPDVLWAVGGVGENWDQHGVVVRRTATGWTTQFENPEKRTGLSALSVVTPTLAFAAGMEGAVYRFDGVSWAPALPSPGFAVRSLKAFSATELYAVGESPLVRRWDGAQWQTVADFSANGVERLNRIRGPVRCELWVVGSSGLVATTLP